MAVPDILVTKVIGHVGVQRILGLTGLRAGGLQVGKALGGTVWQTRGQLADAVGLPKGSFRGTGPKGNNGVFQRADPQGLFPAPLVVVRQTLEAIPANPVNNLYIKEVEVHRVRIHTVMGDFPKLHLAIIHNFGGWVNIPLHDKGLVQVVGQRNLYPQAGTHPAIFIIDSPHLVMDCLGLHMGRGGTDRRIGQDSGRIIIVQIVVTDL